MGVLIMGRASASVEQMQKYIKSKNPGVEQTVLDMIPLYLAWVKQTEGNRIVIIDEALVKDVFLQKIIKADRKSVV